MFIQKISTKKDTGCFIKTHEKLKKPCEIEELQLLQFITWICQFQKALLGSICE